MVRGCTYVIGLLRTLLFQGPLGPFGVTRPVVVLALAWLGAIYVSDIFAQAAVFADASTSGPYSPQTCPPWQIVTSPNPTVGDNELDDVVVINESDIWAVGEYLTGT